MRSEVVARLGFVQSAADYELSHAEYMRIGTANVKGRTIIWSHADRFCVTLSIYGAGPQQETDQ